MPETEITDTHEVVPPTPPPEPGPPPFLLRDVAVWLALFGLLVVAGLLVWIFVFRSSSGKGDIVPAVVGMPQQRAIATLTKEGFAVKAILAPARKPRGIVASQSPGGGSRLAHGGSVTLHVSNGRPLTVTTTRATTTAPTTTAATQALLAAVPDVSGQDFVSAAGQIEAAGFVAETDPVTASGTAGSIVQEEPPAGTQSKVGTVVRLGVVVGSNRPQVQVPNVVGQKAAAARTALLHAKLTAKTVYRKSKRIGVVLGQTPTGSVPAYTQVVLTVGR